MRNRDRRYGAVAAGRLTQAKAFDRLLDLVAQAEGDLHVTILGDGEFREDPERKADSFGIAGKVDLAGFIDNPWPYYGGADAFLLTRRYSRERGCPYLPRTS